MSYQPGTSLHPPFAAQCGKVGSPVGLLRKAALVCSVVIGTAAGAAGADESPQFTACMTKAEGVTSAMLDCGKTEIDGWDRRMNAAYQTLMQSLADNDRQRLRAEQRTWLKHHLAETKRLASDPDNGSVALLESQSFELSDLSDRTLKLENRVNGRR